MTYQVLARKWRPQDFSSLVGQGPIVTALRNAMREGRIAHAYLFSGIRGVGKTTAARVLAKALNCERGPAADPCNACTACVEITRGSDLDVVEVDAATYSKVEQVRDLTESLKYGPARDRYKVVVLDEVHRLSRQAFDALLKIVEEPPPHLVFIFATTEIDAVPATILSRCQEFHFRRVPSLELAEHLRAISEAEKITASGTALRLIARAGEGSVRDSVALLDQLATFGSGSIADEDAVRLLGGLDTALFHALFAAMLAGDSSEVYRAVRRVEEDGWDPRHVFGQYLAFCRDALHLALGTNKDHVDLPAEEAEALATLARGSGYENLLRLIHHLLGSEMLVRRSDAGVLALEIAWLRAAELPKLTRVEELLRGESPAAPARPPAAPARAAPPVPAPAAPRQPAAPAPSSPEGAPAPATPVASQTPTPRHDPPPQTPRPSAPPAPPRDPVRAFLDEVSKRRPNLAGALDSADKLSFSEGCLTIVAPAGDTWLGPRLAQDVNRAAIDEALAAVWGPGNRWSLAHGEAKAPLPEVKAAPERAVADNPTVQAVLDIFGGRVETVEENEA